MCSTLAGYLQIKRQPPSLTKASPDLLPPVFIGIATALQFACHFINPRGAEFNGFGRNGIWN